MIGILKTSLQNTDKDFFAIRSLNQLMQTSTNACLFCDYIDNDFKLQVDTNVLQRANMFKFNGILITDNLARSQDFVHSTYAKKRFLYLYHLEWPYIEQLSFTHIKSILLNDDIGLIARSVTHAKLITQLFKKPEYIMPELNYKTLIEIDHNE